MASAIFHHAMTAGQAQVAKAAPLNAAAPSTSSTSGTSDSDSSDSSATISANDFLTLLVTEMKNQDPTADTDPNEYINQLVQVNSLEQLIDINQTLSGDVSEHNDRNYRHTCRGRGRELNCIGSGSGLTDSADYAGAARWRRNFAGLAWRSRTNRRRVGSFRTRTRWGREGTCRAARRQSWSAKNEPCCQARGACARRANPRRRDTNGKLTFNRPARWAFI